ncbi:MAG: long-chain fatty acid--CoA ligase, partial [Bacteroidia bacterium]
DGRFLKITDRKKEMFKTSGGKFITPQHVENKLKESRFIEQAMVIGENEKFPSAFIVPAFVYIKQWCEKRGIPFVSNEEIIKNEIVRKRIMEEVEYANTEFAQYEKLKRVELLPREWTVDHGELTPKLSLKRKVILAENKEAYDRIYKHIL